MRRKIEKISEKLFSVPTDVKAAFENSLGRPIKALSDRELVAAYDYAEATRKIIAAEMWARTIRARLRPAPESPAETPVVARRDDAPIP